METRADEPGNALAQGQFEYQPPKPEGATVEPEPVMEPPPEPEPEATPPAAVAKVVTPDVPPAVQYADKRLQKLADNYRRKDGTVDEAAMVDFIAGESTIAQNVRRFAQKDPALLQKLLESHEAEGTLDGQGVARLAELRKGGKPAENVNTWEASKAKARQMMVEGRVDEALDLAVQGHPKMEEMARRLLELEGRTKQTEQVAGRTAAQQ